MATRTFHISFPIEWAKEIENEMKKEHYTPSEYFKKIYRQYKEERDFAKTLKAYEAEEKAGKLKELKSVDELFE